MKIKKIAIIVSIALSALLIVYFYLKENHITDAYANLSFTLQSDIVQLEGAIDYQIKNNWQDQNNVIEKVEDVRESINYLMITGKHLGIISKSQEEDLWKLERFFVKYPVYTGFPDTELNDQQISQLVELKNKLRNVGWGMNIGYHGDWKSFSEKIALLLDGGSNASNKETAPSESREASLAESNDGGNVAAALPDKIELMFAPVQWAELQSVEPSPDWQLVKTIPFGNIGGSDAVLDIFETTESQLVNAVLKFKDHRLLIPNISNSLLQNDQVDCSQICLFQQHFSGQHRYQLIGSIDISLNGPGLYTYIVYDEQDSKIMTVDLWGEISDNEPIYEYTYEDGVLMRKNTQ